MQLKTSNFSALLHTLSLTQGLLKPAPLQTSGLSVDRKTLVSGSTLAGLVASMDLPSNDDDADSGSMDASDVVSSTSDHHKNNPCAWEPYNSSLQLEFFAPFDKDKANVYRYRQQQSVNLGSWFVHEAWMTPSLFTCAADNQASEVDIAHGWQSVEGARSVLERHWDTFITEQDFSYLASIGINTVRLPIGYWNLGSEFCKDTPFEDVAEVYRDSWQRVVRAINYAGSYGIGVLVDLHGAPGSQNGQQHSGVSDGQTTMFGSDDFVYQTIRVLTFLMKELASVTNIVGIQLLNEPNYVDSLEDFYTEAIEAMRGVYPNSTTFPLYLHDGFKLERFSNYVASRQDFVVQDHHSYFVFTPQDESETALQHTEDVETDIADSLRKVSNRQRRNLVIDEFSCALSDDSLKNEDDPAEARRKFCTGQTEVYANTTAGWAFWAYRKEECDTDPGWCFVSAVGKSLPSSFFSYGIPPPPEPSQLPSMSNFTEGYKSPNRTDAPPPPPIVQSYEQSYSTSFSDPAPMGFRRTINSRRRHARMSLALRDSSLGDKSWTKGYQDGFLTAKIFAAYGLSKLGFTGQYILDSITALGPAVIAPGTEQEYESGFLEGLSDGEAAVTTELTGVTM